MKSFIIILLLYVIGGSKLFAQKTEFIASAPSVVEVGEQFRLSFVLNNKGENLQVPTIKGFDLLAGPNHARFYCRNSLPDEWFFRHHLRST